jgi:long chain fatty acid CoA FadD26
MKGSQVSQITIPELVELRADEQPDDTAYTFVDYESDPAGVAESLTWSELRDRVGVVAEALGKLGSPGERALVVAPQGLEYVVGFLGAIRAGFIAVPLSVPQPGQHDDRIVSVLQDCAPVAVLTTSAIVDDVRQYAQAQTGQRQPRVIEVDALDFDSPAKPPVVEAYPKVAYLQYTSGSTRAPAGVEITHKNAIANLDQAATEYFEHFDGVPEDLTIMSWAPLYHDMGLILGLFFPLCEGRPGVLMSPVAFMQKPARWIQQMGAYPSVITAGPNFAFEVAVRRCADADLEGLDLSRVLVMINGGERVHGSTVRRFAERFGPLGLSDASMRPTLGMAEAAVFVVTSAGGRPPTMVRFDTEKLAAGHAEVCEAGGTELVTAGTPRTCELRVVDPETLLEKPAGEVGELWMQGDQVGAGYWRNPEATERTFNGQLAQTSEGTPGGRWLRTGDLAVMFEGEVFIIGRLKDLLIVDGRNHYPDDIEATVAEVTGGRVAAVAITEDTTEKLIVIAEVKESDPDRLAAMKQHVTAAVSRDHGVRVSDAMFVGPRSLPITTSGKVRRKSSLQLYKSDKFSRVGRP